MTCKKAVFPAPSLLLVFSLLMTGAPNPQSSLRDVWERFCELDNPGKQLTPDGSPGTR